MNDIEILIKHDAVEIALVRLADIIARSSWVDVCVLCGIVETIDLVFFFFFQAEDGIRDGTVTGVQTCALPIYRHQPGSQGRLADAAGRDGDDRRRPLHRLMPERVRVAVLAGGRSSEHEIS